MKKLAFLVASLFLICTASFAQSAQNQACTFEQAVSFNTASNLAESDFVVTISDATRQGNPVLLVTAIVQALNTYKAKIQSAANGLPLSCWRELVTAENRLAQCQAPAQNALAAVADRMPAIAQRYAQTGNRQAYENEMRGIVTDMLNQVPRQCWFQPVSLPSQTDQPYCAQAWSEYTQCYQANQNVLAQGGTLQICYRPLCSTGNANGNGACPQLWSAYHQCEHDFQRCTVITHGTGPCPVCNRPACPEF